MIIIIKNIFKAIYSKHSGVLWKKYYTDLLFCGSMIRLGKLFLLDETLPQTHSNGFKGNEGNICSKMRDLLPAEQASSLLLPADFSADL